MNTTNEPAGIDLDNEHIEKIWNSLDGKQIIAGESQLNWNAALRREFAKAIARDVLARHAPAPVAVALDKDAEKQRFITWGQVFHRNARSYTARDFDHGLAAWLAAKADAVAQQSPAPVVAHDAPEARAYQPEGATGTTGAQDDLDYLLDYIPVPAARAEAKAKVADLRAQLAAKGQGAIFREIVQSIIGDGYLSETNMHRGRLALDRAAPASAQPDRGAAQDGWKLVPVVVTDEMHMAVHGPLLHGIGIRQSFQDSWERALAAAPSPASQPVAPEAPDLLDALQKAARLLRAAGFAMTGTATSQIVAAIEAHAQQEAAPAEPLGYISDDALAMLKAGRPITVAVSTSSKFERNAIYAAPTTVPDHSEREAANAGGLDAPIMANGVPVEQTQMDWVCRFISENSIFDGSDILRAWDELVAFYVQHRAPATIAAGQEAANAKDAAHVTYTCKGKGGAYSLIGVAYGAGTSRDTTVNLYREVGTGVMYFRTPADFHDRMERINAAMAAVGAAGKEGGDRG